MFERLFDPIQIGKITLPNRIVMAPMATAYSNQGYVSEQQIAYYAARARGGVGLIITEHTLASKWAEENCPPFNIMNLFSSLHIAGFGELAESIHAFGARAIIQLNPGLGSQGSSLRAGLQPKGPSAVNYEINPETVAKNVPYEFYRVGEIPREMTIEEIEQQQANFAMSAGLAAAAGFDGIEIHAAHGFLIHDFISPRFNRRTDGYGGSLENRMRFLIELIRKTRAVIGSEMVLGVRMSAHEPEGTTFEDMKEAGLLLDKEEVDYFHLGDGTFEALNWLLPDRDGTMLEMEKSSRFKKDLRMPVITPSIHDPAAAEKAITEGLTDMVSLGRALFADPEWANKVKSGRISEIMKCTRCNIGCYARLFQGLQARCVVNPECGLERYNPAYTRWTVIGKGERKAVNVDDNG